MKNDLRPTTTNILCPNRNQLPNTLYQYPGNRPSPPTHSRDLMVQETYRLPLFCPIHPTSWSAAHLVCHYDHVLSIVRPAVPGGMLRADTISTTPSHWRYGPTNIFIHQVKASGAYFLYVWSLHVIGRSNSGILRCPLFRRYSMCDRTGNQIAPALHVRYGGRS